MTNEVQITLNIQSSFFLAQSNLILYTQFLPKKKYKKSFKSIICNIKQKFKNKFIN